MATNWEREMQEKFDTLQRALTDELRTQFVAMGSMLDERWQVRLDNMAARLDERWQVRLDNMGARLDERWQVRLDDMGAQLDERWQVRLDDMGAQLEERLERRLDQRLSHRLQVQMEELRDIVRTATDYYGGALDGIHRALLDLNLKMDLKFEDHDRVLANHNGRLNTLEGAVFPNRTG